MPRLFYLYILGPSDSWCLELDNNKRNNLLSTNNNINISIHGFDIDPNAIQTCNKRFFNNNSRPQNHDNENDVSGSSMPRDQQLMSSDGMNDYFGVAELNTAGIEQYLHSQNDPTASSAMEWNLKA